MMEENKTEPSQQNSEKDSTSQKPAPNITKEEASEKDIQNSLRERMEYRSVDPRKLNK